MNSTSSSMFLVPLVLLLLLHSVACFKENNCNIRKCCPEGEVFESGGTSVNCTVGLGIGFNPCKVTEYGKNCPIGAKRALLNPMINEIFKFELTPRGFLKFNRKEFDLNHYCVETKGANHVAVICVSGSSKRSAHKYVGELMFILLTIFIYRL